MSDHGPGRIRRRTIVLAALLGLAPVAAGAQSTADAHAEIERLLPDWRAARERAAVAERARRDDAGARLIERGHLRITADSAIVREVSDAAAIASASLDRVFGAEATLVAQYPMVAFLQKVMHNGVDTRVIRLRLVETEATTLAGGRRIGGQERVITMRETAAGVSDLVLALEAIAAAPLHATLDDELRYWFRSPLPGSAESQEDREGVYVDITTASTDISRRCLAGESLGCAQALGLAPVADPIMEGHTAAQRRIVVEGNAEDLRTPGNAAEFDRCVTASDDAACISRLRDLPSEKLTASYSTTAARRSFARWAIARGGPDAYSRLRSSEGLPLLERFALAARVPADSLFGSWHAQLMTGRPTLPSIPPVTAFMTLLYIGACGALSLRSSRWR